jgi:hypothetical protein
MPRDQHRRGALSGWEFAEHVVASILGVVIGLSLKVSLRAWWSATHRKATGANGGH